MSTYNVVFCYTEVAGAYNGVITWTHFDSKTDFDAWMERVNLKDQIVVAEGVTIEQAVQLCRETPTEALVAVANAESIDPGTGEVNVEILRFKAQSLGLRLVD